MDLRELTPQQKTSYRTGQCDAVVCPERCRNFMYHMTMDTFPICLCGHTQHSHRFEGIST